MRKKNPLYWNLSVLDEETFKQRAFSIFRKDRLLRKPSLRGTIKTFVGTYPRKGEKLKWLPNATLRIFPGDYLELFNLDQDVQGRELVSERFNEIREVAGVTHPNDIVHLADIDSYIGQGEMYTPFMMLHDLGESLFAFSYQYADSFDSTNRWQYLQNQVQDVIYEATVDLVRPLIIRRRQENAIIGFIPKLVHTQLLTRKPQEIPYYLKWIYNRRTFERIYIKAYTPDVNWLSDVWALWCKNGELRPSQFYTPRQLQEFLNNQLGHDIKLPAEAYNESIAAGGMDLEEWCLFANSVFTNVLDYLKGGIVAYGEVIKSQSRGWDNDGYF